MAKGLWVLLNVDNLDKSIEFYKAIGYRAKRESEGEWQWATVPTTSPDTGLVLMDKHNIPPGQAEDTKAWLSGELGKGVLVMLGVANVDKAWAKAQEAGATVEQPLREQAWGAKEFTLLDPDGYVLSFTDRWPGASASKPKKKASPRKAGGKKPAKSTRGKKSAKAGKRSVTRRGR